MTAMYREFTLRSSEVWQAFASFVREHAKQLNDNGTPLRVIVTTATARRNAEQNKRYWGFVLRTIAEQVLIDKRHYDADVWHEYFARKFGTMVEMTLPDGEIITRRKSTTEMTVGEFTEYMTRVEAHATQELGVRFEAQV